MLRYYVIATLIVVVFGSIVFAHRLAAPDLKISAQPSGTPTVERRVAEAPATARPFTGQGPWVLSALPSCFDEQSRARGPYAELASKLPPAADRIAPGTTLTVGDCSLTVRDRDIWVDRNGDRLRVPPDAKLYRVHGRLTLAVRTANVLEIRRY
jgi:hypothetical protein